MRRILLLLAALPLLAGCGAAARPQLAHDDAAGLIALAARIAGEGACAQSRDIPRLHARTVALVNARRVPAALQEPLLSGVNALAAEQPVCLPSVRSTPAPTPQGNGNGRGNGHGEGHGNGNGGGDGGDQGDGG